MSNEATKQKTIETIVPNYFHIENYNPKQKKKTDYFTIGKHSRVDMLKFSDNFPQFYENLNLVNPKYRVMGVNQTFRKRFENFNFSTRWELLKPCEENVNDFLSSLDIYVYDAHESFIETHCRATVEAMLLEIPVVAPNKPNFKKQIVNGINGFLWNSYSECQNYCELLQKNKKVKNQIAKSGRIISEKLWCNKELNLKLWNNILKY
jgi:glycosyltransferase involved in cell wall biosynthesis